MAAEFNVAETSVREIIDHTLQALFAALVPA
jgi:hypothetical protein